MVDLAMSVESLWAVAVSCLLLSSTVTMTLWRAGVARTVAVPVHEHRTPEPLPAGVGAAMDALVQGLVLLDADRRLVLANRLAYEFYPSRAPRFERGTHLHDMTARHVAEGYHPGHIATDLNAAMDDRLDSGNPFDYRHDLPGGRIVRARWQPLPDGGWCGTYEDITEQHRSVARIAHMARYDALTELVNREAFTEAAGRALARATRRAETLAVLVVSIDGFRRAAEGFGHATGDTVLREAAGRLRRSVRDVDVIGRLRGEEFGIVQAGVEQPAGAESLARRIIEVFAVPFTIDGQDIIVGASVGIVVGPGGADGPEALVRNAGLALAYAKSAGVRPGGRGEWSVFAAEMDAAARARQTLEADLRRALAQNEFELFYQPLVNIGARRVSGFEALLRWRHPERGLIPPDAFIPLAEETGLIVPIGEWVLHTACAEAMTWQREPNGAPLRVAVNLSAIQVSGPGLVEVVEEALAGSGLPGARLELEVTESVLLQDSQATLDVLHRLRALGARISMDDFGTGYSSLRYLRSFPFDKIKIDKSFVRSLNQSGEDRAIVRAIAGLGISLGIATTAEGVETYEQLETLIADGCTEVQGYFFSPPRPAAEVPALILAVSARQAA